MNADPQPASLIPQEEPAAPNRPRASRASIHYLHAPEPDTGLDITEIAVNERSFKIRLADTEEGRSKASLLINKMYSWRGYAGTHQIKANPNRITLAAFDKTGNDTVGTITLNIDSDLGLLADEIFKDEIDAWRSQNNKLCELIKLAVDPNIRSKAVLASLFHIAFIYGRRLNNCSDVFIEVNPRHVMFYKRMLGFQMLGQIRTNRRVDAPACLLSLPLDYVEQQIKQWGGKVSAAATERSLYPYFFSPREELGLTARLQMLDQ